MCGIMGLAAIDGPLDAARHGLPDDAGIIGHRGPDAHGHFLDDNVYLGHRRLAIIDLSADGKQPIYCEDERYVIVFNGEVYNFQEIRKELEAKGRTFRSQTDTEVIVQAFAEWGHDCVDKLRGMFAFAIWDRRERRLWLVRDRLGIKPLFYAIHNGVLYFASEMKAILQYGVPRDIDPEALASYFMLTYIPAPLTIYSVIRKLPPGQRLELNNGQIRTHTYWDLRFEPDESRSEESWAEELRERFDDAVNLRLISDVPLGAFLSGGMDSGAVLASMSKYQAEPTKTFCIGFGGDIGGHMDERGYARQVADVFGAEHHEFEVIPKFDTLLDEIVDGFDEPFADSSTIPTYHVCKETRQHATVALSGLGGDELFGGYERYLGFKLSIGYNRWMPHFVREQVVRRMVQLLPERADGHYTINHLKRFVRSASLPGGQRYLGFQAMLDGKRGSELLDGSLVRPEHFEACQQRMVDLYENAPAEDPLDKVFYVDFKSYLPEDILACTDRMSMAHSLEVRVPFLDHPLVEFAGRVPNRLKIRGRAKKYILQRAVQDRLPKEIFEHRKQGFIGPMPQWLQSDLKPLAQDMLSESSLRSHGMLNPGTVNRIMSEHFNREETHDKLIWALMMFQHWHQRYIQTPTRAAQAV